MQSRESTSGVACMSKAQASPLIECVSPWLDEGVPEVGQRVVYCSDYGLAGVVKFAGSTEFSDGHDWVGIMLDKPRGKNDGRVKDKQYFTCPPNHGLFMRAKVLLPEEAVAEVAEQPPEVQPVKSRRGRARVDRDVHAGSVTFQNVSTVGLAFRSSRYRVEKLRIRGSGHVRERALRQDRGGTDVAVPQAPKSGYQKWAFHYTVFDITNPAHKSRALKLHEAPSFQKYLAEAESLGLLPRGKWRRMEERANPKKISTLAAVAHVLKACKRHGSELFPLMLLAWFEYEDEATHTAHSSDARRLLGTDRVVIEGLDKWSIEEHRGPVQQIIRLGIFKSRVPTTGEDDETVEALLLRNAIADKWLYLRQHEATTDQVKQFKDMLKSFLDLHGDELAFAPFPIMPSAAPQNRLAKVDSAHNADGYRHYVSIPEWYALRFVHKLPGNPDQQLPFSHFLIAMLRIKNDASFRQCGSFVRMLKRCIHLFSQAAEEALEQHVTEDCPSPEISARYHPFLKSSRLRGNRCLAMNLVQKFMARGGGYVTVKNETQLQDLNVLRRGTVYATRTSTEFAARSLAKAQDFVGQVLQSQQFKTVNCCFDGATVNHEQVLSVVMRMGGCQFAGATQLLSATGSSSSEIVEAAASMASALQDQVPAKKSDVIVSKDTFKFKEYRTATKTVLCGITNSLKQCLPDDWTLLSARPANLLVPAGPDGRRCCMTPAEARARGFTPDQGSRWFTIDSELKTSAVDFYENEDHYRLCWAADEGTEGWIAWQHVVSQGGYVAWWSDIFHKAARKSSAAIRQQEAGEEFMRKMMRLFKYTRGPYKTSKFGKSLSEARDGLLEVLRTDKNHPILDPWIGGIARDEEGPLHKKSTVAGEAFAVDHAVAVLKAQKGRYHVVGNSAKDSRWFAWFDNGLCWDKVWHSMALTHSFAFWLEGRNPWSVGSSSSSDDNASEDCSSNKTFAWNAHEYQTDSTASIRTVISLSSGKRTTLAEMQSEWKFVTNFVDLHFNFDHNQMTSVVSEPFRMAVNSLCGITGEKPDSLLSSLPSELAFNDLRDAARRATKCETTAPSSLHSICLKSAINRPAGAAVLELQDSDWMQPYRGKSLKSHIHHSLKPKDCELGINADGLTRHKQNKAYTKPHIFHERLRLLKVLHGSWVKAAGELDERADAVKATLKTLWVSKLVPRHCFLQWRARRQGETERRMVLSSGPHAALTVDLQRVPEVLPISYTFAEPAIRRALVVVGDVDDVEIALTKPTLHQGKILGWAQTTDYMSLPQYVADHTISTVPATLLSQLCSALGMRGHGKMGHRRRVEAFLREMGKEDDYIQSVLDEIPEKEPKPRRQDGDGEPGDGEEDRLHGQTDDENEQEFANHINPEPEDDELNQAMDGAPEEKPAEPAGVAAEAAAAMAVEDPRATGSDTVESRDDATPKSSSSRSRRMVQSAASQASQEGEQVEDESSQLQPDPATDDVDQGSEKLDLEEASGEQEAGPSTEDPPSNEVFDEAAKPNDGPNQPLEPLQASDDESSSSSQPAEANEPKAAPANAAPGANAAPDRRLAILQKYEEFKEMGHVEAAAAVLRQGLYFCPDSAVLKALAAKEGMELPQEDDSKGPAALMEQMRRREMMMQQMHLAQQRQRMQQIQQWQAHLRNPRYTAPPTLPEPRKGKVVVPPAPTRFYDELEYPDKKKASRGLAAVAVGALFGFVVSILECCSAYYLVWSFLACHLALIVLLRDSGSECALLLVCGVLAFHGGHALAELGSWLLAADGEDSLGPWSIVVIFACILYLQSYLKECKTLPPDYLSTLSFFFPVFPAYDAAVALSCLEFFLEWRYFPDFKLWTPLVLLGIVSMALGQGLVSWAARVADRNFWASTRELEEDELVGLEIPNRRVVREGPYAWERHPAYLGALLWGLGTQLALCNPGMLVMVGFVLWASLLHVTMEEEKELYDEFPGLYVNYAALTSCWIPGFPPLLENSAFQREMDDNAPEQEGNELMEQEESEEEIDEEDDLLPTWEGVPKGGAIWNRQFQEPWRLG
ncbi:Protein-S-isoprenylcysteine O-methyltransferase [Symbiodinium microadriaticum]|uniref:Protein-S-isoprenylcysteine O-methyltransferase n=1 Tax=Symbiodinium microadriaticum TaxID=2951 RepID=A0A1Q9CLK5_SYMMI|nr:Protein-S-isoprenylcysteine O-methyltransferase [Symbiodinium microadriaticum]